MGIPFIPPNNAALRSMVRLPDSGWDTSLPSSVLDLSRSSGIAATVRVGPFPFITRNTIGASAAANSTNTNKLSEAAPNRQAREVEAKEREATPQTSGNSPVKKALNKEEAPAVPVPSNLPVNGPQPVTTEKGANPETENKGVHPSIISNKQPAKRSEPEETTPKEVSSAKRFKPQQSPPMSSAGPRPRQYFMVSVGNNQTSSNLSVKPTQVQAVILVKGNGISHSQNGLAGLNNKPLRSNLVTSQENGQSFSFMKCSTVSCSVASNQLHDLKGLQQEAMELRAANNHLKQHLANYQNLFKDKKKLQTVIEILYNNQQPVQ